MPHHVRRRSAVTARWADGSPQAVHKGVVNNMAHRTSQHDDAGSMRDWLADVVADPWLDPQAEPPNYSARQHQTLLKAGQMIVGWAVEVARYEADLDWQWVRGADDDPAVTAGALARLIRDARSVIECAEALYTAVLSDDVDHHDSG
jgi:hypothetical protein